MSELAKSKKQNQEETSTQDSDSVFLKKRLSFTAPYNSFYGKVPLLPQTLSLYIRKMIVINHHKPTKQKTLPISSARKSQKPWASYQFVENYLFSYEERLNEGAHGSVYKGRNILTGQPVSIKLIQISKLTDPYSRRQIENQIRILSLLSGISLFTTVQETDTSTRDCPRFFLSNSCCQKSHNYNKKLKSNGQKSTLIQVCASCTKQNNSAVYHKSTSLQSGLINSGYVNDQFKHNNRSLQFNGSSPNILKYLDSFRDQKNTYIVTELCQGGDLLNRIRTKGVLDNKSLKRTFKALVIMLLQLKKAGIIHRDIKSSNIFISTTPEGEQILKLGDFGYAIQEKTLLNNTQDADRNMGTPLYMSFEALMYNQFSYSSDIFSMGVVLYELAHGKTPWQCRREKQLVRLMQLQAPKIRPDLDQRLQMVIVGCLLMDRHSRMTVQDLVKISECIPA